MTAKLSNAFLTERNSNVRRMVNLTEFEFTIRTTLYVLSSKNDKFIGMKMRRYS